LRVGKATFETVALENELEPLAPVGPGGYYGTGAVGSRPQLKHAVRKVGTRLRLAEVLPGLGRTVALHYRSSALYQIHERIRRLCF
jgi:hypothetical protein